MIKKKIDISIIFLTFNGISNHFKEALNVVRKQKTSRRYEIIAIDSGSKDGTAEYLKKEEDIIFYEIPNAEFGHGKTRQFGATIAKGELVVFLTQDATPADENWLDSLIENFSDPEVVGVCGRILPRHNASLLRKIESKYDLCGRKDKIIAQIKSGEDIKSLSFGEKREKYYFFNDISSAIRREYLMKHPFPNIFFAEDVEFAKLAINNGKKIIFEPDSVVVHSHPYSIKEVYKRNFIDALYHKKYLGINTVPNIQQIIKNAKYLVKRDFNEIWKFKSNLFKKIILLLYSPIIHFSEQFGRYRGSN